MAWAERGYGTSPSNTATAPTPPPDALPEIPPMFKRDKEAEATAKQADVYVRFMQQGGVVR